VTADRGGTPGVTGGLPGAAVVAPGLFGLTGVALGAFGAHALKARLGPELLEVFRTGVFYQLVHAVALLGIAGIRDRLRAPRVTTWLFSVGIVIFSGSLYALATTGVRLWGAITPLGGLAFLAGWASLLLPRPRR
jgi:uncharacterized membrane protein YgdD (TMEM256/DUF423 family)